MRNNLPSRTPALRCAKLQCAELTLPIELYKIGLFLSTDKSTWLLFNFLSVVIPFDMWNRSNLRKKQVSFIRIFIDFGSCLNEESVGAIKVSPPVDAKISFANPVAHNKSTKYPAPFFRLVANKSSSSKISTQYIMINFSNVNNLLKSYHWTQITILPLSLNILDRRALTWPDLHVVV